MIQRIVKKNDPRPAKVAPERADEANRPRSARRVCNGLAAVAFSLALLCALPSPSLAEGEGFFHTLFGSARAAEEDGSAHYQRGLGYAEQALVAFTCAAAIGEGPIGAKAVQSRERIAGIIDPALVAQAEARAQGCIAEGRAGQTSKILEAEHLRGAWYARQAFTAFTCVAALDEGPIGGLAARSRDAIGGLLDSSVVAEARRDAEPCIEELAAGNRAEAGPNAGTSPLFDRLGWAEEAFFAPGEAIVIGFFELTNELHLTWLRDALKNVLTTFGTLFPAALSVFAWLIAFRLGALLIRPFGKAFLGGSRRPQNAARARHGAAPKAAMLSSKGNLRSALKGNEAGD